MRAHQRANLRGERFGAAQRSKGSPRDGLAIGVMVIVVTRLPAAGGLAHVVQQARKPQRRLRRRVRCNVKGMLQHRVAMVILPLRHAAPLRKRRYQRFPCADVLEEQQALQHGGAFSRRQRQLPSRRPGPERPIPGPVLHIAEQNFHQLRKPALRRNVLHQRRVFPRASPRILLHGKAQLPGKAHEPQNPERVRAQRFPGADAQPPGRKVPEAAAQRVQHLPRAAVRVQRVHGKIPPRRVLRHGGVKAHLRRPVCAACGIAFAAKGRILIHLPAQAQLQSAQRRAHHRAGQPQRLRHRLHPLLGQRGGDVRIRPRQVQQCIPDGAADDVQRRALPGAGKAQRLQFFRRRDPHVPLLSVLSSVG